MRTRRDRAAALDMFFAYFCIDVPAPVGSYAPVTVWMTDILEHSLRSMVIFNLFAPCPDKFATGKRQARTRFPLVHRLAVAHNVVFPNMGFCSLEGFLGLELEEVLETKIIFAKMECLIFFSIICVF